MEILPVVIYWWVAAVSSFTLYSLLLWIHEDRQSLWTHEDEVTRCQGGTWTYHDKGKLQLCCNKLALISFKQNDHVFHLYSAECKYMQVFQ